MFIAQFFAIHPDNPRERLVKQTTDIIRSGKVVAYSIDSCYALGCRLGDKVAIERTLTIRKVDLKRHLTLTCADLRELGIYAEVDNAQFRQLKIATPGSYTFILQATKEVPNRTLHPKRETIGLRVPDSTIAPSLLQGLDKPLLGHVLMLPEGDEPLTDPYEIRGRLEHAANLVIGDDWCDTESATIINMTDSTAPIRKGKSGKALFGL